jgi:hypothetical protein
MACFGRKPGFELRVLRFGIEVRFGSKIRVSRNSQLETRN